MLYGYWNLAMFQFYRRPPPRLPLPPEKPPPRLPPMEPPMELRELPEKEDELRDGVVLREEELTVEREELF